MKNPQGRKSINPENPNLRQSRNPHNRPDYLSHRQAALTLGVTPPTLDKLAVIHGLTIRQVPGHSRRHFLRSEVEALAAKSITTEALA